MALYTIHAPRQTGETAVEPADLVFIKDGFCWPALFIPVIWLIARRLWLVLLLYLVLGIGLAVISGLAGPDASIVVMLLFSFWFALEANGLRRWTIERHRYDLVGVVEGRGLEEAERRYFDEAVHAAPVPRPAPPPAPVRKQAAPIPPPPPAPPPRPAAGGIVGLFPTPDTRR